MQVSIVSDDPVNDPQILNDLCAKWGYTGFLPDGVTPQTQIDFVNAYVLAYIQGAAAQNEIDIATRAAQAQEAQAIATAQTQAQMEVQNVQEAPQAQPNPVQVNPPVP